MEGVEPVRVLVGCEYSGRVRDAFRALGHVALSCDLLPTESTGPHYCGDVFDVLEGWMPVKHNAEMDEDGMCPDCLIDGAEYQCPGPTQDGWEYAEKNGRLFARPEHSPHWDLIIAHPPCTYLASSGLHWNKRVPERAAKTEEAIQFVQALMNAPSLRIAIENPVGCLSSRIRKPDQIIQPWHFGDDASKKTCLWLKGLPKLKDTDRLPGDDKTRRANQTPSGQNNLGPSPDRWKERSRTYQGIANAMAAQWGISRKPRFTMNILPSTSLFPE